MISARNLFVSVVNSTALLLYSEFVVYTLIYMELFWDWKFDSFIIEIICYTVYPKQQKCNGDVLELNGTFVISLL